jgi:hypothetical protein
MRLPVVTLALLVIPASVGAQQAEPGGEPVAPRVELERTTPAQPATAAESAVPNDVQPSVPTRSRATIPDAEAAEAPAARRWWWLVGAVLAGGLLLSLML